MNRLLFSILAVAAAFHAGAQSIPGPGDGTASAPSATPPITNAAPAAPTKPPSTKSARGADQQSAIDRLNKSNQELLDLLNQQQEVLKDMQLDRRLLNRQVMLVEQRLEDSLHTNASLESKIAKLEAEAAAGANAKPAPAPDPIVAKANAPVASVTAAPPPPPASYLPAESTGGAAGTMWWHRLISLSGQDTEDSKTFHITGKQWRVLWHNQDRAGEAYKNTSALFISAFPANDSIPKRVCSKLGSGGDATELTGTGDFYLRIEASGGCWELAAEDFR